MSLWDFKDLTGRIASDKIFRDNVFNIIKNPKYDGWQGDVASMVYKPYDKKTSGSAIKNENFSNNEVAEKLHKPIIKKFKKRKVKLLFIDNILMIYNY